jgi:RHH-type proline utilization regulon transcriptional repressor/proline dehydrogenase/delta 1-pyrroline-5-carboxylate dehydrogenase
LHQLEPGESWLVTPTKLDDAGLQWSPGVKLGVAPGSWSHQHEWFGPVLGVMVAPDFATAIDWQNRTHFGLTSGIQSLDESECEQWMQRVQAGNLYVNRGITGAVVNRQPFGGWRRSSVGPTAKAGGHSYVNCLREWSSLSDPMSAVGQARCWWEETGSQAIDRSGLLVEKNIQRYRHFAQPIVVRIDNTFSESELTLIDFIRGASGVNLTYSTASPVDVFGDPTVETVEQLIARAGSISRVRWLSNEVVPTEELLEQGVTVDRRSIAQRGDIEMPRWLLEQSVAITHHRYGNVNAGPKPHCPGLGEGLSVFQSQVFLTAVANFSDHRGMLRRRHRR